MAKDIVIAVCAEDVGAVMVALKVEAESQRRFGHEEKADRLEEYVAIIGEAYDEANGKEV